MQIRTQMLLASAALFMAVGIATAEYADIPCNKQDSVTPAPDQSLCTAANSQGACTLDSKSGNYYCGWKGATCPDPNGTIYESELDACDFGTCQDGKCSGTFGDECTPNDELLGCLGWLLCSPSGFCGGEGAACSDFDGCVAGLECVFPSLTAISGVCREVAVPPPGPSQRRHRREIEAKQRKDTWH